MLVVGKKFKKLRRYRWKKKTSVTTEPKVSAQDIVAKINGLVIYEELIGSAFVKNKYIQSKFKKIISRIFWMKGQF